MIFSVVPFEQLLGTKVVLRRFRDNDISSVYLSWLNDIDVVRFSNQRFVHHTVESSTNYLRSFDVSDNLFIAIEREGQLVGTMTAYLAAKHGTADLGILIGRQSWGKGFGTDAFTTLMRHLFTSGARKLSAGTLRCNIPMIRIAEKSGMRPDGVRLGQQLVDNHPEDVLYFARFADPC